MRGRYRSGPSRGRQRPQALVHRSIAGTGRTSAHGRSRQWISRQPGEPRKNALLRFTLKVPLPGNGSIVFPVRLVQDHPGPIAGGKVCFADVRDVSRSKASDPNPLTDDEAVRVGCQDNPLIWKLVDGERGRDIRMSLSVVSGQLGCGL